MADKLQKEKYFLFFLLNTSEYQQKILIKHLTKPQMNVIIEVVYNALLGNLIIPNENKKRMKRYRHVFRKLISKGISQKRRRAIILKYFKQIIALIKPCETWLRN